MGNKREAGVLFPPGGFAIGPLGVETGRAERFRDLYRPATVNFAAKKEGAPMTTTKRTRILTTFTILLALVAGTLVAREVGAQKPQESKASSFTPVVEEPFDVVRARDKAAKAAVMAAHRQLLEQRYDLTRRVDEKVRMTRGKPIPVGPTARLKSGATWESTQESAS